ncbi:hypothetical protein AAIH67_32525, partial [Pseudomonas aeruginosa]
MRLSRFPISTLLDSASGHLEAHLFKKRLDAESGEPLAQQYSGSRLDPLEEASEEKSPKVEERGG